MAIDSKGNNHQPKGTPNAGRFAPEAGRAMTTICTSRVTPSARGAQHGAAGTCPRRVRATATWPHSDGP